MFRRILPIAAGVFIGFMLAGVSMRYAAGWSLLPNRELNKSADYVKDVLQIVNESYVDADKAAYKRLTREALHGLVESLDPHSEFLEEKDFKNLDEEMRGDFGGVGLQVESRDGRIVVITPIMDTPAEKAGILRGDEILAVDGASVESGTSLDAIIDKLRGKPGTKVAIRLFRPGKGKTLELTIVRQLIKVASVRAGKVLGDGVGYLQLTEFTERTGDEFVEAVNKLLEQGIHSLVLDLRNNPGGLLDAAVYVAEPFFNHGDLIVYTQGRKASDKEELRAETEGPPLQIPMVVLINAGSASAAEIVAGALKDTGKAVIVGERSFGKGSVQSIIKLRDGEGMRLTTARYFTPRGVSIHGKGISPDIEVVTTPEEDEKLREQRYAEEGGAKPGVDAEGKPAPVLVDRQLEAALDALKGYRLLEQKGLKIRPRPVAPAKK